MCAPLLEANSDIALVGRELVVTPVHHVMSGVLLDKRSMEGTFVVLPFQRELFGLYRLDHYCHYDRVYPPGDLNWQVDDPAAREVFVAIAQEILLPWQRQLTTIEAVFEHMEAHFRSQHGDAMGIKPIAYRAHLSAVMGDFETAAEMLRSPDSFVIYYDEVISYRAYLNRAAPELGEQIARYGNALPQAARDAFAQFSHSKELENVRNFKIEKYWKPTPFPFEPAS